MERISMKMVAANAPDESGFNFNRLRCNRLIPLSSFETVSKSRQQRDIYLVNATPLGVSTVGRECSTTIWRLGEIESKIFWSTIAQSHRNRDAQMNSTFRESAKHDEHSQFPHLFVFPFVWMFMVRLSPFLSPFFRSLHVLAHGSLY